MADIALDHAMKLGARVDFCASNARSFLPLFFLMLLSAAQKIHAWPL